MGLLSQVPELKYALGLGGMMSFYGIVSLVVWVLPTEKYGYAATHKIVVIALILLTLPIILFVMFVSGRRKKKAEKAKAEAEAQTKVEEKPDAAQAKLAQPAGNYDDINQAAEEAVKFLKSSNVGGGKDAVYELPWYLVIGNPKSGKSSLSLASGLNFQNLPGQRQSEQKFIRPTRNVDWRVTSDAVFLDTAGRYQLEGADQDEWSGLLETLVKYRGNRPLDGMILSVSAERILQADDSDIEQMAKVLRSRIDETIQRTKIRFPIYLVFTHADSIEGFRDSFSTSQKEGENLVWGATIPLEKSENGHTQFDSEFDLLQNSIMKRRLMRLSAPFPPVRQLKIFNFPLHFGSARKKLGHFVSNLFRPNPFSESPFLRGFYFTAVPVNRPKIDGGQTMTNVGQTVGQSYFTQKLFRDVILRDKDLVASFQSQKVSAPIMGWLLTILGAFLTFALLIGSGISLYKNWVLVNKAKVNGEAVLSMVRADQNRSPLVKNPTETRDEIDKIEALHESLAELDKNEREWVPLLKWFGLYSGNRIYREKLLPIYYNAVEQRYKKPILKKLESDLQNFSANNNVANPNAPNQTEIDVLDKNFDLFRAYLMLSKEQVNATLPDLGTYRDHAEPTTLYEVLKPYMLSESKVPEAMVDIANQQIEFYFQQIKREDFPGIKLEANLVDATRKKLQAYPAWAQYYKRVTTDISNKVDPVNADTILAGKGGSKNILLATHTVPGAYTLEGYRKYMIDAVAKASGELNKDDWVMGGKAVKEQVDPTAISNIEKKYYNDYINNWKKFVSTISIPQYKTKDEAINALQVFSDVNSPLKTLLEEVSRQTNLSAENTNQTWTEWFWSLFKAKQGAKKEKTPIETEFDPLFKFTATAEGKGSQISNYGGEFQNILKCSQPDCDISKLEVSDITNQVQTQKGGFVSLLSKTDKNIDSLLSGFKVTTTGQEIATVLKKPLGNLNDLVGGGVKDKISKDWADVFAKAKDAEKGYPFDGEGEADLTKLTAYLNPVNGSLTEYYNKRLKNYFEGEVPNLKVKETSEVKFSDDFVKYLNNAFRLRDALFGKNPTPSFTYDLKLQKINEGLIEIKIDGQSIDTNATGSVTFNFPSKGGETGAFVNFSSTAETTPGKTPLPANTSANSNVANVSNSNTAPKALQNSNTSPPAGSGNLAFQGTWGLFHFFEKGNPKKEASGEYTLTYGLGGKKVIAKIKPTGSSDLFDRTIFTSVRAPQNILK